MAAPRLAGSAALLLAVASCSTDSAGRDTGLLTVHPHPPTIGCPAGLQTLSLVGGGDALLYVPEAVAASKAAAPLLLFLHGAGGKPERPIQSLSGQADARGFLLVAPRSLDYTWDAILGQMDRDVLRVERTLSAAMDRCDVDGSRLAVGGFSDGASYALTLGLANGDLFTHVLAFSPCLVGRGTVPRGSARFFVSHGRADEILPFTRCGAPLAKKLEGAGYRVRFLEFEGRHQLLPSIAEEGITWWLASPE